jgi:23S rRNA (adenine2503-C2)-methyltransferase
VDSRPQLADGEVDFFNLSFGELKSLLADRFGATPFRATQMFEWVYRKGVTDLDAMTNIGKELRSKLSPTFSFPRATIRDRQISSDGTRKYLFEVDQGDLVESVMIKQAKRMTLCVSSQVGCAMGCTFCRTAQMGLKRHLSTSEIIRQVNGVIEDAKNFGDSFSNIVFMGMGEPLHNFDGVTNALRILLEPLGFGMSPRKITVSTSGLVPAIDKLSASDVDVSLAVSLNATTDELRSQIMPVNRRYPIAELLRAVSDYPNSPRRRVTIEYVMLGGLNDKREDMNRLIRLMHGRPVKVNLIPYNSNAELGFDSPSRALVIDWQRGLNAAGIQATIRWSKGADIKAACGQLATDSRRLSLRQVPTSVADAQAA